MEQIISSFYNKVIPEALNGTVDCELPIRIIFNVQFKETGHFLKATDKYAGVIIPTLFINNKNHFDTLLTNYVEIMMEYYQNMNIANIAPEYYIPYIISTAIANMGAQDYLEPENFFAKRIKAIKEHSFELSNHLHPIGFSPIFKSDMYYVLDKEFPNEECPFRFTLYLKNNEETFEFQTIRFYIVDNICYIGAIQGNKNLEKSSYEKKIKRILYKANENINENHPLYQTNPGAVVALTAFISFLKHYGIDQITIAPYGIQRWNDKKILYHNLHDKLQNQEISEPTKLKVTSIIERTEGYFTKADVIRTQLSNALLRFNYHFYNDESQTKEKRPTIICYEISNGNNALLNEVYGLLQDLEHKKTNHQD